LARLLEILKLAILVVESLENLIQHIIILAEALAKTAVR